MTDDNHDPHMEEAHYDGPEGGWGSLRGIAATWRTQLDSPSVLRTLQRQNKPGGFMCVSCAWTKPAKYHALEFCENGAKATLWELTSRRCTPDFFAEHTLMELRSWSDHDLEQQGRLTHPLRYDPVQDKYVACNWDEALTGIGAKLRALDPKSVVFYSSGRASLKTSYLYALFARAYGNNNLPDSSNMCHETTSVALKETLGVGVGTVVLEDFEHCDAIFFFGQNTGSNSPRFLHTLEECVKRGVKIVTFNPVRERGLEFFVNPQNPYQMATGHGVRISAQYCQVRAGGDIAVLMGMCKCVFHADDEAQRAGLPCVLDVDFIEQHTRGFSEFETAARNASWDEIETESGLSRADIEAAAHVYLEARNVIGIYGMGLTQQRRGFDNVAMFVNLLLLRGQIGRKGGGLSPVRGHSNVQGQRTVGITEKPELAPLDKLKGMFGFEPPRDKGMNTVETCEGVLSGKVQAFIGLGGNFVRAIPERDMMEAAWTRLQLHVEVATRLNRSHLIPGEATYLLPCLGRSEEDMQNGMAQTVTIEDSLSCIHGSMGRQTPASPELRSEVAIVCGLARATLSDNPALRWQDWMEDYGLIRDQIERTYPDKFADFNQRLFTPGGFYKGNKARERQWETKTGKANFVSPDVLSSAGFEDRAGRFRLVTLRSNDQFNTTIYGFSDRPRGIEGRRDVLLISPADIERSGLSPGDRVNLRGDAGDDVERVLEDLVVTPFDLPEGTVAAYYPEANALVPLWHHDRKSKTPASKCVPVRIVATGEKAALS